MDNVTELAKKALKRSGRLNVDPNAYALGFAEGVKAAVELVREALGKFVEKKT